MEYVYKGDVDRFVRYATEVFGIPHFSKNPEDVALAGVKATKQFFEDLLMPTNFKDAKIPTDRLEDIAKMTIATNGGKPIGAFKQLAYEDILAILKSAAEVL
jgi:alcohol dehydrogenase YqhD (iron-dependent ADH family)